MPATRARSPSSPQPDDDQQRRAARRLHAGPLLHADTAEAQAHAVPEADASPTPPPTPEPTPTPKRRRERNAEPDRDRLRPKRRRNMKRRIVGLMGSLLLLSVAVPAGADKLSGMPTASEMPFVNAVTADLTARFPTASDARKAGYVRFTDEDNTGRFRMRAGSGRAPTSNIRVSFGTTSTVVCSARISRCHRPTRPRRPRDGAAIPRAGRSSAGTSIMD